MKIGFDLDGTLDRPAMRDLALALLHAGHQVYVITGVFPEAVGWQDDDAKRAKLGRLGVPFREETELTKSIWTWPSEGEQQRVQLHILQAVPMTFPRDYRLADLGLRKGALCERLGVELFFDDSSTYCEMIPKMSGNTLVCKVGESK